MKALSRSFYYNLFAVVCLLSVSAACSSDDPSGELGAPEAITATDVSGTSFVANWNPVTNASGYQIDISTDNFATFIADYNSKSVTATTETVTGLTAGTTYKYRVRSSNDDGVSANSNEIAVTTAFGPIATINGAQFIPTDLTLTDTNIGLELHMKNGAYDVTFRLSDKVAGTYELLNVVPNGRTAAVKTAIALWSTNEETFYGESGTITVSVSEGKVSLTFNATGKSESGNSSTITNGNLENTSARPAGIAQCVLATYSQENGDQSLTGTFGYDSEGRLIQFVAEGTNWNYFWTDSRITKAVYVDEYELRYETWTYQNELLTGITGIFAGDAGDGTFQIDYTYTGGKLTTAVREDVTNTIPFTYTNTISYNGDNVSSVAYTITFFGDVLESYTDTYSQFDSKNNFWQLFAQSTNNPLPTGFSSSVDGESLSMNNVGKITKPGPYGPETVTFTYPAYNAAGYPTSLTSQSVEGEYISSYTAAITYSGCN